MTVLGPLGFSMPWLLLGLVALPLLWFLLRAVPPAPVRRRFPGVALLLGLTDEAVEAERTPWWLLALRMLALAAAIVGFAGPVLNPQPVTPGQGPLLIVEDGSWASARDWPRRMERIERALSEAAVAGRPAAIVTLAAPPPAAPVWSDAATLAQGLAGIAPAPWEPVDPAQATPGSPGAAPERLLPEGAFETLWLSDGLARAGRAPLLAALEARGPVRVWQPALPVAALGPARIRDGAVRVPVLTSAPMAAPYEITAIGPDPSGIERELARVTVGGAAATGASATDATGEATGPEAVFELPPELRNRVTRFAISGLRSAGAVSLTDDAVKRRKVALISGGAPREGLELLAPTHYLRQALAPSADLIEGTLEDALTASPDVIILADVAEVAEPDRLADWLDNGGLLVRFAGPRLAGAQSDRDRFLPVLLRQGGRSVGGTMSWGEPRRLAPFPDGSPFAGLRVPEEITVREQVMAEPSPELATRTIAALADGTPLVTRAAFGAGQIVLFHVTANADWSNLALAGLFPQMLERLAVSARPEAPQAADLAGQTWVPVRLLDAFGQLSGAEGAPGVAGETLATAVPGPGLLPGVYAANGRTVALNALAPGRVLTAAQWPSGMVVEGADTARQMPLKGLLLALGLAGLLVDIIASLAVAGRLRGPRAGMATVLVPFLLALPGLTSLPAVTGGLWLGGALVAALPLAAQAQQAPPAGVPDPGAAAAPDGPPGNRPTTMAETTPETTPETMPEPRAVAAAGNVVLAYMPSGDPQVDATSMAGMRGLSQVLFRRTTVEPSEPMQIDLEQDDLALFTLIYWPVLPDQPAPGPAGYAKLNRYLRGGGMILFDTRDADLAAIGTATEAGRRLQALAAPLEVPPLEPIPPDHVLTRTFYLLQSFPGRHDGTIWVEAAPVDAELAEGMPFRNLNDGVTPVVIGGNDWASAWAVDQTGQPMFPLGRGSAGERQREIAWRFGVNLVMHVLTGNYKSDQVHVPALLERLGQ